MMNLNAEAISEKLKNMDIYENAKKLIMPRLIARRNVDVENDQVFFPFLDDMAIVFNIVLDDAGSEVVSAKVTTPLLDLWKVSKEEIYEQALRNLEKVEDVFDTMGGIVKNLTWNDDIIKDFLPIKTIYVVTNKNYFFGATSILKPTVLKEAERIFGGDYYIIPSSVHECILLRASGFESQNKLNEMVQSVNNTVVSAKNRLSDSVMYYSTKDQKISRPTSLDV